MLTSDDLHRVSNETFVTAIERHAVIDSTNNRALALAKHASHAEPCLLVLADRQTAGRGRGANTWWSEAGALTFSLLLDCRPLGLPVERWPVASLLTGLAVCDAFDDVLGGADSRVKWPNDVYLAGRKACGILIESADYRKGLLAIGIGVNVNNSASGAPHPLCETAISLSDHTHRPLAEAEVLVRLLQRLEQRLAWAAAGGGDLQAQWRPRCLLTGRQIEALAGESTVAGRCLGIDPDGALLLEAPGGPVRLLSGVVTRVD
ncbi:Bifunctional ligase/repressor BirA [Pirellulimonas nuda]|uniref:biotin--[biotin carboxyl-carrier protein] ligase n=1 Tax=Pirellulimonas nuda TaxID=2528009 RepID=A0A518DFX8_9BACT|nr:biotin--[acetyl-CoA-carboxylase] ligase [Pirellulimonas nuda]QDU90376.1 Bifunctional ligase/repressor BirA [Pirellulimonas nuda]